MQRRADETASARPPRRVSWLRGNPGAHHLFAARRPARGGQERTAVGARPTGTPVDRRRCIDLAITGGGAGVRAGRAAGHPHSAARTARCAPAVGSGFEPRRRLLDRLATPHLPQGAPTSPAAANLLAHHLDRRLCGLADTLDARYGRYADDLVFSADRLPVRGLVARVTAIAAEEGFRVRPDKTRIQPAHHRQRVTGLVVNAHPAVAREEYDALRALLHNCARTGPERQNRDAHPAFADHLRGRISWVATAHPTRGARLRALFDAITW